MTMGIKRKRWLGCAREMAREAKRYSDLGDADTAAWAAKLSAEWYFVTFPGGRE